MSNTTIITDLHDWSRDHHISIKDENGKVSETQLDHYIMQLAEEGGCDFKSIVLLSQSDCCEKLKIALNYIKSNLCHR